MFQSMKQQIKKMSGFNYYFYSTTSSLLATLKKYMVSAYVKYFLSHLVVLIISMEGWPQSYITLHVPDYFKPSLSPPFPSYKWQ